MTFCAGVMPGQEEEEEEEALESYVDPWSLCIWMWNPKTKEFRWATPREWAPFIDPKSGRKYWWNPKTEQIFWPSEIHLPSDACGSDGHQLQRDALETVVATLSTPTQADAVQIYQEELVCGDQAHHQLPHLRGELACGERCVNCSCRDTGPEMLNLCCLRCRETDGSDHDAQCDKRQPQPDALETSAADAKQQQPGKEDDMLADWSNMKANIMSPRSYQRYTRYNKIGH